MTKEQATQQIEKEFSRAAHAREIGNEGMMRVCARRAAGIAITHWLQSHPRNGWGVDAMSHLRSLQLDESIPRPVRDAAVRLITKITEQFTAPFSTHPIEDSRMIINHLLEV